MNNIKGMLKSIFVPLISILIGLIIGGIILWTNGYNPIMGFANMLILTFTPNAQGQFLNLADVLNSGIPLILCGFSVAFAYKSGLFNIGAEGQFMAGLLCALYVGTLQMPSGLVPFHPIISIIAGMIGGGLWALIPGLLKAYLKVSEVVTTILMNLIALKASTVIIQFWFHDPQKNTVTPQIQASSKITLFNSPFTWGLIVVLAVAVFFWFVFKRTKWGYELKAVGYSPEASLYAGINHKAKIIQSLVISGCFAGLAGAIYGLQLGSFATTGSFLNFGFNGIVVAMLANLAVVGIIISGLLLALFTVGIKFLGSGIQPQIGEIIVAIIFICSSIGAVIKLKKQKAKKEGEK